VIQVGFFKRLFLKKVKDKIDDKVHKVAKEITSPDELIAPLNWAQRLKHKPETFSVIKLRA